MYFNAIDRLAESNAQLFREIKSRLKPASITLAVAISLCGQIFTLMLFGNATHELTSKEWQSWFWLIFMSLSAVGIFVLLVMGTYLLISDLSKEEEKGTLNVIRLSPESANKILIGKLLGVPILLYLVAILALPLHFFSGVAGGISPLLVLGFYVVLVGSCIFFYSLSLLFALLPLNGGNVKAGLFSCTIILILAITSTVISGRNLPSSPFNWLVCFNPWLFLGNALVAQANGYRHELDITWYKVSFYDNAIALGIFLVFNYGIWTAFIWRGLQRRFHNPSTNLFTKAQSYLITASWQIIILGFVSNLGKDLVQEISWGNFCQIAVLDFILYSILIANLTPHRQAIQDWSRYRHYYQFGGKSKSWQDLVFGNKSPAIVAIGLNAILASLILIPWILMSSKLDFAVMAFSSLIIGISLTLIYALVAQLVLLSKKPQRGALATGTLAGLAIAPLAFAIANYTHFDKITWVWLYSIFPWVGLSVAKVEPLTIISACILQWLGVILLGWQLQRSLKAMGASQFLKSSENYKALPSRS